MPTIRHPRLVRPGVLSGLKRTSILMLLSPYADYFAARGAPLDEIGDDSFPLHDVVSVITSPVESTPPDLVERLELIDLISDTQSAINFEDGYQQLVAKLREDGDSTDDLAVKILIHAPDVAWREFDRQAIQAPRSLVALSVRPGLKFRSPNARRIEHFRELAIPWFKANDRSGICHVHVREESNGVSFVIRHGDPLKRIGVYEEDGKSGSRLLRPERVDVAHFRHLTGEWQISGIGAQLQELYRQAFGTAFHGSANALVHSKRYSLEPLRDGPSCLKCDINSRIQVAELVSLKIALPSGNHIPIGGGDAFKGILEMNPMLLHTAILLEAKINLKISNRRRLAQVVLNPLCDKVSGIHLDDAIEPWLKARHFANDSHEGFVLESA